MNPNPCMMADGHFHDLTEQPYGNATLTEAKTQGVDGPSYPPIYFPPGTRVLRTGSVYGEYEYVDAQHPHFPNSTAMLTVRSSIIKDDPT